MPTEGPQKHTLGAYDSPKNTETHENMKEKHCTEDAKDSPTEAERGGGDSIDPRLDGWEEGTVLTAGPRAECRYRRDCSGGFFFCVAWGERAAKERD